MKVRNLDHLVLTVADIEASAAFYARVLGVQVVSLGAGRTALRFGEQKINLHEAGKELEPRALHPTPSSADLCLVVEPQDSEQVLAHLHEQSVEVIEGPVRRTGALGPIESFYFRDIDAA
jgi:catechol 2,3-dioxygenase-like lactoylglutathione lyase family enzyme